jgi:hypothetical protein
VINIPGDIGVSQYISFLSTYRGTVQLCHSFCDNIPMSTSQAGSADNKVAIHEAGHALMFDALGIPLQFRND